VNTDGNIANPLTKPLSQAKRQSPFQPRGFEETWRVDIDRVMSREGDPSLRVYA